MMNHPKFLRILWSALFIRYAAIYVPLVLAAVFSRNMSLLLPFTIYYWLVCCVLILAEKFGSYTEIAASQIIERHFFFKITIPISNIVSIKDGYSPGIIGNPKSVDMEFTRADGRRGVQHILLHQFGAEDIKSFVDELSRRNAKIEVSGSTYKQN
jgi:hypothetical protein